MSVLLKLRCKFATAYFAALIRRGSNRSELPCSFERFDWSMAADAPQQVFTNWNVNKVGCFDTQKTKCPYSAEVTCKTQFTATIFFAALIRHGSNRSDLPCSFERFDWSMAADAPQQVFTNWNVNRVGCFDTQKTKCPYSAEDMMQTHLYKSWIAM